MSHEASILRRFYQATVLGLACLASAGGLVLLATSESLSFGLVRFPLGLVSADGSADAYTWERHRLLARPAGGVLLIVGACLLLFRHRAVEIVSDVPASVTEFVRALGDAVRRPWREEWPAHLVALALVVVTGIALRVTLLDLPMRYDEASTFLNYARYPLKEALTTYTMPNNHLFHTLLMHLAYVMFGVSPWALRLPAFVAGVLALPVGYLVARAFVGGAAALLSTAVLATSMVTINMSTDARGYTIVILVFLLLLGLGQYLRRSNNGIGWVAFAGLGALGAYTIPIMVYAFATVLLWLLLSALAGDMSATRRSFLVRLAVAGAAAAVLTALLYAPILIWSDVATILASPTVASKVRHLPWGAFVERNVTTAIGVGDEWTGDWPFVMRATLVIGFVVAALRHACVFAARVPVWAAFLGACIPILLVQRVVPFGRIWSFLFPYFCFMAAGGVVYALGRLPRFDRARVGRVVIALVVVLVAWQTITLPGRWTQYAYGKSHFLDAEPVVLFLKGHLERTDGILLVGFSLVPFFYYCERYDVPCVQHMPKAGELVRRRRVFVIVNEDGQTLESVLEAGRLTGLGPAVPVARNPTSRVYLVETGRP